MEPMKLLEIIEVLDNLIAVAKRMRRKCWLLYMGVHERTRFVHETTEDGT